MSGARSPRVQIPPPDDGARRAAEARQRELLKPPGSLGRLERLAVELAAMTGGDLRGVERAAFLVFAADHGVAAEGVSAYPAEVTRQMVRAFLSGGAAIAVLARRAGFPLWVVDVGVCGDLDAALEGVDRQQLVRARVRDGARNFAHEPALRPDEVDAALAVGATRVEAALVAGAGLIGLGEMGIGNTTAAAAVLAAATGCDPRAVTGPGTGIDGRGLESKVEVVRSALARHRPDPDDPLDVLAKVGGLEIAALTGAIVAAAAARTPVLLDGFIVTTAALLAEALAPGCRDYLIAAHRSREPGHGLALERLALSPLLDLDLRLGEGSGAALALPVVIAAAALHTEMATFAEAGVSAGDGP
jgi:nicotinate-nucleotide--dimethylbenzimidazole phosphoribosyltransferase